MHRKKSLRYLQNVYLVIIGNHKFFLIFLHFPYFLQWPCVAVIMRTRKSFFFLIKQNFNNSAVFAPIHNLCFLGSGDQQAILVGFPKRTKHMHRFHEAYCLAVNIMQGSSECSERVGRSVLRGFTSGSDTFYLREIRDNFLARWQMSV